MWQYEIIMIPPHWHIGNCLHINDVTGLDDLSTSFWSRFAIRLEVVYTSSRVKVWYLLIIIIIKVWYLLIVKFIKKNSREIIFCWKYLLIPTFPRAFVNWKGLKFKQINCARCVTPTWSNCWPLDTLRTLKMEWLKTKKICLHGHGMCMTCDMDKCQIILPWVSGWETGHRWSVFRVRQQDEGFHLISDDMIIMIVKL